MLATEYVEARQPRRPWRLPELQLLPRHADRRGRRSSRRRRPSWGCHTRREEFAEWPAFWDHLRTSRPDLPHLEEAAALAGRFVDVMTGETLVHTDVRDDNILITTDGRALLCDWNWPMVGAAWLDSLFLLIGPRGDGLDVASAASTATRCCRRCRPRTSTSCSRW